MKALCLSIFVLCVAVLAYSMLNVLDFFVNIEPVGGNNCKTIPLKNAAEDFEIYKGVAIAGLDDRDHSLFKAKGASQAGQGSLARISEDSYEEIPMINFPKIPFHPHGIYLLDSYLYVINHAFGELGDQIEVFELSEVEGKLVATHMKSIKFGPGYSMMLNDLVVLDHTHIYVTTWISKPASPEGKHHMSILDKIYLIFENVMLKHTEFLLCEVSEKANCQVQDKGFGFNGITKRGNQLFVVEQLKNYINVYDIQTDRSLLQTDKIAISSHFDNIVYMKETDSIIGSGILRLYEFVQMLDLVEIEQPLNYIHGHATELVLTDGKWTENTLVRGSVLSFPSVAIRLNGKLILGSPSTPEVAICSLS